MTAVSLSQILQKIYSKFPEDCEGKNCVGSQYLTNVRNIVGRYLERFTTCTPMENNSHLYSCADKDGVAALLSLKTERGNEFLGKGGNPDLVQVSLATWTLVNSQWEKTDSITCNNFAHCSGKIKKSGNLEETYINRGCDETYRFQGHHIHYQNCNLSLFEKFLKKETKIRRISMASRGCSFAQLILGAVGVLYFGVKSYREIRKIKEDTKDKPLTKEQIANNKPARKWSRIYGTASLASLLLAVYTWYADFRNVYYNSLDVNHLTQFR